MLSDPPQLERIDWARKNVSLPLDSRFCSPPCRRSRFTSSLRDSHENVRIFFSLWCASLLLFGGRGTFPCAGRGGGGYDSRTASKLNWSFGLRRSDSNLRIPHYFRATMFRQERIESCDVWFNEATRIANCDYICFRKITRVPVGTRSKSKLDIFIVAA